MGVKKTDIISLLQYIIYKIEIDAGKQAPFRIKQYQDTCKFIDSYEYEYIHSFEALLEHYTKNNKKHTKILDKVKEMFDTGKIHEAELAKNDPRVKSVMNLTTVYGIGPKKSLELYDKFGINTISLLKNQFKKDNSIINSKQKIGLEHYDDLCERIPRVEMDAYNQVLNSICNTVSDSIIMSINGSYRRELPDSGDIDLLITSKNEDTSIIRKKLINELKLQGIIIEVLADGKKKFMGIVQLKKLGYTKSRHIDIMDTKPRHFPFAVLYFTGSGSYNSKMRGEALKQGYSLNEYCLSDKNTKKEISKDIIYKKLQKESFETEQDIFQFLDIEYKIPAQRM